VYPPKLRSPKGRRGLCGKGVTKGGNGKGGKRAGSIMASVGRKKRITLGM